MTTATTAAQTVDTTAAAAATTATAATEPVKVRKPKKEKQPVYSCPITNKDGEKLYDGNDANAKQLTVSIDVNNISKSIGAMLTLYTIGFNFKLFGRWLKVPALNANNDQKLRTFAVVMAIVNLIFDSNEETRQSSAAATNNPEYLAILKGLQSAGFKFKDYCKVAVVTAVQQWQKNATEKRKAIKNLTLELNSKMIAETVTLKEFNKESKARQLAAITGFSIGYRKTYGLPPVKIEDKK